MAYPFPRLRHIIHRVGLSAQIRLVLHRCLIVKQGASSGRSCHSFKHTGKPAPHNRFYPLRGANRQGLCIPSLVSIFQTPVIRQKRVSSHRVPSPSKLGDCLMHPASGITLSIIHCPALSPFPFHLSPCPHFRHRSSGIRHFPLHLLFPNFIHKHL